MLPETRNENATKKNENDTFSFRFRHTVAPSFLVTTMEHNPREVSLTDTYEFLFPKSFSSYALTSDSTLDSPDAVKASYRLINR
jgi:hypothetical protein